MEYTSSRRRSIKEDIDKDGINIYDAKSILSIFVALENFADNMVELIAASGLFYMKENQTIYIANSRCNVMPALFEIAIARF